MNEHGALAGFTRALGIGIGASAIIWALAGIGSVLWNSLTRASSLAAWPLVTVVIANVDMSPDTQLAQEMFSTRRVPKSLVTANSVVPEDLEKLVQLRPLHGMQGGQLVRRSDVGPAREMVTAVFATRDMRPGEQLTEDKLIEREVWSTLPTDSWFRDKASVVGRVVTTRFAVGEPILSTHLAEK